jgi:hypothetical protein
MKKCTIDELFRITTPRYHSDFVACRIEKDGTYYVFKCVKKPEWMNIIIGEVEFKEMLCQTRRPLILSDAYTNYKGDVE